MFAANVMSAGPSFVVPGVCATWNPADKNAAISLSNGNLTAAGSGTGWVSARANISKSSGKWYWEIYINSSVSATVTVGNCSSSAALSNYFSSGVYGQSYIDFNGSFAFNTTQYETHSTFTTGDTIGLAMDASNGNLKVYKNNTLQGTLSNAITGPYFPGVALYNSNGIVTANFGNTPLTYTPPAGYNPGLYS